uniref:Histone-lysine N-methyltransferase n=1 Tax=Mesocestoides corti TaxID=53468 RepID=A0A5K3EIB1_MESCO
MMDSVPLTLDEETESIETFVQVEKTRRMLLNANLNELELDNALRIQWPAFDIATKRSYLSNKLEMLNLESEFKMDHSRTTRGAGRKSVLSTDESSGMKPTPKANKSDKPKKQKPREKLELDLEIHRLIASPAPFRFQPVCPVCEVYSSAPGQMLKCNGPCGRIVHPRCMRYKEPPKPENQRPEIFKCPQCLTQKYLCAVCGDSSKKTNTDDQLLPCQMKGCGRHFHRGCLAQHPGVVLADTLSRCPAHVCATCCLEDPDNVVVDPNRPMLQCVRCPRVYHTGDLCTPAGSVEVSLSHIVCPAHFSSQLSEDQHYKTQWPAWCFACLKAGADRVFCKTCPFNYHRTCLPEDEQVGVSEESTFTCKNCRQHIEPRYAQVVWAKIPFFRWWPCEIIHARNAPLNIFNLAHPEGTFLIHFIGSGEYQWVCRAQTFPYECGLNTSAAVLAKSNSKKDVAFNLSAKMAPKVHEFYVNYVWKRGIPLRSMSATRLSDEELVPLSTPETAIALGLTPHQDTDAVQLAEALSSFQQVVSNQYANSALEKLAKQELPETKCDCAKSETETHCSKETECRNASEGIECTDQVCSVLAHNPSVDCGNRPFSVQPSLAVFRTTNRGFGLKVLENVKEGSFVVEFMGEVIGVEEANRRLEASIAARAAHRGHQGSTSQSRFTSETMPTTYLIRFTPELVIDAEKLGNLARFVNHSCEPNLVAKLWNVRGTLRMGLFALSPLSEQDELTLDYQQANLLDSSFVGNRNICLCGADSCQGSLHLPSSFHCPEKAKNATPAVASKSNEKGADQVVEVQVVEEPKSKRGRKSAGGGANMSQLLSAAASVDVKPQKKVVAVPTVGPSPKVVETKPSKKSSHDDFCYRCGDGGELILCDKSSCPKAYHLGCLGLVRPPFGIWFCPWHYCDDCGNPSSHLCWRCPNSYCLEHAEAESENKRIQVDDLDLERWQSALKIINGDDDSAESQLTQEQKTALVLTCRWICADHADVKIYGPEDKPTIVREDVHPVERDHNENEESPKDRRSKSEAKRRRLSSLDKGRRKRSN